MNVIRTAESAFTVTFETEEELREQHAANLSFGALSLLTGTSLPPDTPLVVTLRGPWGGEVTLEATVVAQLPDGLALGVAGDPDQMLTHLLARPAATASPEETAQARNQNTWDRVRGLSQMEKILLGPKADRTERALLLQDNDPRVLLAILRNPRIQIDEVVRLAKSGYLTYQIAEVIMQTGQWMGNLEVRLGLIHNPKTPQQFALRILPSLPESEVRAIARAGTSMQLKQAALRRLQSRA
ncbi:MAG: hypothetical protein ABR524_04070 [Thermoanaerobaculia bacterium]